MKNWYHKHIYVHTYSLVKNQNFSQISIYVSDNRNNLKFSMMLLKKLRFEFKSLNQGIYIYIYILTLDEISTIRFIKNK